MKILKPLSIILFICTAAIVTGCSPELLALAVPAPPVDTDVLRQITGSGHGGPVNAVAFSPDGRLALSGSEDSTLKLWEVTTRREIRTLTTAGAVLFVKFLDDGRLAISLSATEQSENSSVVSGWLNPVGTVIQLWDTTTGKGIYTMRNISTRDSIKFSPDNRSFLSGVRNRTIVQFDTKTGREIRTFTGHIGIINKFTFSPDGQFILSSASSIANPDPKDPETSDDKNEYIIWDVVTGKQLRTFIKPYSRYIVFAPDGKSVFSVFGSFDNGKMVQWDVLNGEIQRTFPGKFEATYGYESFYENRLVFTDGYHVTDNNSELIKMAMDLKTLKVTEFKFDGDRFGGKATYIVSPDGRFTIRAERDCVSGGCSDSFSMHDLVTGVSLFDSYGKNDYPSNGGLSVAFSPDGNFAIIGSIGEDLYLFDVSAKKMYDFNYIHGYSMSDIVLSPDGRFAIVGSGSLSSSKGTAMLLYDITTGLEELHRITKGNDYVQLAFSPDGQCIFSKVFHYGSSEIWDVATGKKVYDSEPIINEQLACNTNTYSNFLTGSMLNDNFDNSTRTKNGRFVFDTKDGKGKILETSTGREIKAFTVYSDYLNSVDGLIEDVKFSSSGLFALSMASDGSTKLWDLMAEKDIYTFHASKSIISPNDLFVLAYDGELKLLDLATGKHIRTFIGDAKSVADFTFSQDSRLVFSSGTDGIIRVWDVASGQEITKTIPSNDGEWSTFTPDGYYNTSPEGKSALHYASNTETYGFEQFESLLRRPDIIKARLAGDLTAGTPAPKLTRPPRVTATATTRSLTATTDKATYPLAVTAASEDDVVQAVRVFVNGRPAVETPVNAKTQRLNLEVPLFAGPNRITTVAYDSKGFSSNQESIDIVSTVPGAAKPTLYVMAAGVSTYPNMPAANQLEYAHSDANALVQTLRAQKGKLFQDVRDFTMVNQEVTSQQLEAGLNALSAMDANDIAVIFLAGHGIQGKDGSFWYVTPQGSMEHPEQGGLDWQILGERISHIKGRVILFLDACHSGSIVDETIVPNDQLAAKFFKGGMGGVMVFSASKGRQTSIESPDIGGGFGAFTYALTQGLGPKATEADRDNNGFVEFMELVDYVSKAVNTQTAGQQTPWLSRKELFGDLAIATVKK